VADGALVDRDETRPTVPARHGEIRVARDAEMLAAWDERGYEIPGWAEGAQVIGSGLALPTVVTPNRDDAHSRAVIAAVTDALADRE